MHLDKFLILCFIILQIHCWSEVPISFSGYDWQIKEPSYRMGPGYNNWSSNQTFIDSNGYLHLNIFKHNDDWYCSEIFSDSHFGYGTYTFEVESGYQVMDNNMVLGLFVYYNDTQELDIELSRWGHDTTPNSIYVMQPSKLGNYAFFESPVELEGTFIHKIKWYPDRVEFVSAFGSVDDNEVFMTWIYRGPDNFIPHEERVHLNLWLLYGTSPASEEGQEVIIRSFSFTEHPSDDDDDDLPPDDEPLPDDEPSVGEICFEIGMFWIYVGVVALCIVVLIGILLCTVRSKKVAASNRLKHATSFQMHKL
ncbi:hypothetical protein GEMRC1_006453 [Eukaryota sp. GEM-RC1]